MITYDDIKKILESVDIAKLEKDYMTRQEVNLLDNTCLLYTSDAADE